jgi:iron-sulfur cluster assembly protein
MSRPDAGRHANGVDMARAAISLTPAAASRVRELMATSGEGAIGLRLGVKPSGCSGFSYQLEFAKDIEPGAEVVETDGIKVVIEPRAVMFVLGTELDFVQDKLGAQFVFRNPNEKARCGCGESFSV